jgi:hypothetical protein
MHYVELEEIKAIKSMNSGRSRERQTRRGQKYTCVTPRDASRTQGAHVT